MDSRSSLTAPSPQTGWLGRRFLLGSVIVVLLTAGATATTVLLEVNSIGNTLRRGNPGISVPHKDLPASAPGSPQTLLLVGDDKRPPHPGSHAVVSHSNEMLLARLDPSKPAIAMLSIPRDLRVTILPHRGAPTTGRINTAYTIGGIPLMLETIKRILGVSVNHVVVMTFPHFKRAVDQMGCVYTTVDRRYFHSNKNAAPGDIYFEINLQPGYQQLCGMRALEFVSYRHGDTALIRDARDQSFLRDVKAQYGPKLFDNRAKFETIFGKAVQTDIRSDSQILSLFELLVQTAGHPIRQVHFRANLGPQFVTATPSEIRQSVQAFLHGGATPPKRRIAAVAHSVRRHRRALSLVKTPSSDLARGRAQQKYLPFALEYPRVRDQLGGRPDTVRAYGLRDPTGKVHLAYTISIDRGRIGEYYDIQGTGWANPPLLDHPDQTVKVGAREYALYYEGQRVKTIAWREGHAVYWINNTLVDGVSDRAMLAMAQQTTPVSGGSAVRAAHRTRAVTAPRRFFLPKRPAVRPVGGVLGIVGGLAGFAALLGVGVLALLLFRRARALPALRAQCEHAKRTDLGWHVSAPPRAQPVARRGPIGGSPDEHAVEPVGAGTRPGSDSVP